MAAGGEVRVCALSMNPADNEMNKKTKIDLMMTEFSCFFVIAKVQKRIPGNATCYGIHKKNSRRFSQKRSLIHAEIISAFLKYILRNSAISSAKLCENQLSVRT
jgi:predicted acetyltransferase